jgi:hypothetical protein
MTSYSQVGQDTFAWEACGKKLDGTFIDVGCHDGYLHSNTLALEELGWRGLLFDIVRQPWIAEARVSPVVIGDALKVDWQALVDEHFPGVERIDFLSLDVDESTTAALERISALPIRFRVICCEHDAYRLGDGPRLLQRSILSAQGYQLARPDVVVGPGSWGTGGPYEDWWTYPR